MTCAQMGGPDACGFVVMGETAEEIVDNGMDHVTKAHPEMAAKIQEMTPDETSRWMEDFSAKFDAMPEM